MAERRTMSGSIDNLRRVVDNAEDNVDIVGAMGVVMADAYADSVEADEHVEEVFTDLVDKAADVVTEDPGTGVEVKNEYTSLTLDESLEDFTLTTETDVPDETKVTDGRSRKVYEDDPDGDVYLDYDMFDFIYGLVTDCYPKPKNPLGHPIRKFRYAGSDTYKFPKDPTPEMIQAAQDAKYAQVASSGDTIDVYANEAEAFDDITEICKLYGFKYDGPTPKKSRSSHWNFSFSIEVPTAHDGYPMLVEDYFATRGLKIEDVMDSYFANQYRKRQEKQKKETEQYFNDLQVGRVVEQAIEDAMDSDESGTTLLTKLYAKLDEMGLKYGKQKIRRYFLDEVGG